VFRAEHATEPRGSFVENVLDTGAATAALFERERGG